MKQLNNKKEPLWVRVIATPILYVVAIWKVIELLPLLVIAWCNTKHEDIHSEL